MMNVIKIFGIDLKIFFEEVNCYMKAKTKYNILKIAGFLVDIIVLVSLTSIAVFFNFDILWEKIDTEGFKNFFQWFSLILYRLLIYFLPGLFLSMFKFDKRFKFSSRLKIWLNWTLGIFLLMKSLISVFEIDALLQIKIFNKLDPTVLFFGYIFTFMTKQKVEFDSTLSIIDPKKTS